MPVAELDGIEIAYELVGEGQPWVLTPGGRFTKEVGGLPEMARALADQGRSVLLPGTARTAARRRWCSAGGRSRRSRPTRSARCFATSTWARR